MNGDCVFTTLASEFFNASDVRSMSDDVTGADQVEVSEDDVCGFGHKQTKQPPPVYMQFTLTNVLISSPSMPPK